MGLEMELTTSGDENGFVGSGMSGCVGCRLSVDKVFRRLGLRSVDFTCLGYSLRFPHAPKSNDV